MFLGQICTYVVPQLRGVARILGKGVLMYVCEARVQILTTPTYEMERSKFKLSQRTRSERSYIAS